jgi:hypothetical protein
MMRVSFTCMHWACRSLMVCLAGLQIWPRVHNQVMFCLILAQLVLVFILAIKKAGYGRDMVPAPPL